MPYRVESTPFRDRDAGHFAHQPFGQVPWLTDGDISIFESGAILLHLGELSDALMPADPRGRSAASEWVFAALNSIEMASVPWSLFKFSGDTSDTWGPKFFDEWVNNRLKHMEPVFGKGAWLAGPFSVADILMADVLRLIDRFDGLGGYPACRAYVARATVPRLSRKHTPTRWRISLRQTRCRPTNRSRPRATWVRTSDLSVRQPIGEHHDYTLWFRTRLSQHGTLMLAQWVGMPVITAIVYQAAARLGASCNRRLPQRQPDQSVRLSPMSGEIRFRLPISQQQRALHQVCLRRVRVDDRGRCRVLQC